jgi:hypothetical protein
MRQIIVFIIVALVLSALRRGRGAGTGPPVAGPWLKPVMTPTPTPAPTPATSGGKPAAASKGARASSPTSSDREIQRRATLVRERVENARVQTRRRNEIEAANAVTEAAAGPRTDIPGGIDPRLLDVGRTPPPTPDPIHPR